MWSFPIPSPYRPPARSRVYSGVFLRRNIVEKLIASEREKRKTRERCGSAHLLSRSISPSQHISTANPIYLTYAVRYNPPAPPKPPSLFLSCNASPLCNNIATQRITQSSCNQPTLLVGSRLPKCQLVLSHSTPYKSPASHPDIP